jgi:hypothetical protein
VPVADGDADADFDFVDFDAEAPLLLLVVSEEPRDPSPLLEDWHPVSIIRATRDVTAPVTARFLRVRVVVMRGSLLSMRDVDVSGVCSRG